jgi:hypothetical protein
MGKNLPEVSNLREFGAAGFLPPHRTAALPLEKHLRCAEHGSSCYNRNISMKKKEYVHLDVSGFVVPCEDVCTR